MSNAVIHRKLTCCSFSEVVVLRPGSLTDVGAMQIVYLLTYYLLVQKRRETAGAATACNGRRGRSNARS